jgi:DNA-binding MarR family transcriptional regulator
MILTPRRKAILTAIHQGNGHPPSLREVGRKVNLAQSWVHYHVKKLKYHGYVNQVSGQCRTLTLTSKGLLAAQGYELLYTCDQDGIHEVR